MKAFLHRYPILLPLFIVVAVILIWNPLPIDYVQAPILEHDSLMVLRLTSYPSERKKTFRYEAQVISGTPHQPQAKVYLYLRKCDTMPSYQDTIYARMCFKKPAFIGTFDYGTYLQRQGISASAYVHQWQVIGVGHPHDARWLQHRLYERYQELGIHGAELGTLSALTLGYREDLDPETKQAFQRSGAMHVLAVSGLHTGILYVILMALLTGFGLWKPLYDERLKQGLIYLACALLLVGFAYLTGCTPSVMRAVVMAIVGMIGRLARRHAKGCQTLLAAAFIILCAHPQDLYSVSFQLSFMAVWGLIVVAPYLDRHLPSPIAISIAVFLVTAPICGYYFHQVSLVFWLTNLIVIPLATMIMGCGVALLTLGWYAPIGGFIATITNWLTMLLNSAVSQLEGLPLATIYIQ